MMFRPLGYLFLVLWISGSTLAVAQNTEGPGTGDPLGRDSILDWNAIALQTVADDFSHIYGGPDQKGPTHTSRALAIIHLAMFDAANMIVPKANPYLPDHKPTAEKNVSLDAAVAQAAADTLTALYPKHARAGVFAAALDLYLSRLSNTAARNKGIAIGRAVAGDILHSRSNDGSNFAGTYVPNGKPGFHDVDPWNPGQGFLDPAWGQVTPFSPPGNFTYVPHRPPAMGSPEYTAAFNDVKTLGGDGITTSTKRTQTQTEIGLFWAYDGTNKIGVPPRLYNQITRTICHRKVNTEIENARLFALVNVAMADAGICCWGTKYQYAVWRPVLGIRRADEDGNDSTAKDGSWMPLGAPNSNSGGMNFTPSFPAYGSGHATFGAALFRTIQNYYGTDNIPFTFVSDELNGYTTDEHGRVRPYRPRAFLRLSDAAIENARSRIYLGIHWQFDAEEGLRSGAAIGDHVYQTMLQRN